MEAELRLLSKPRARSCSLALAVEVAAPSPQFGPSAALLLPV